MSRRLILLRHAHRDKHGHVDNGLSEKGLKQAAKLVKYFEKNFSEEKMKFYTSPKIRCIETISPIAKSFSEDVTVMKLLDEGSFLEERAQEFMKWWAREAPPITVICSHGDWIPYLVFIMTGARIELKKGAFVEIIGPTGAPVLHTLIQEF